MTKSIKNIFEISNRYAKALILSSSNNEELSNIKDDFKSLVENINKSDELSSYIQSPLINSKRKSNTLLKICKAAKYSEVFQGFIYTLTKHGKIILYLKIFQEFNRIIDINKGLTEILITTSEQLDKKVEENIKSKLSELLKLKIKLKKVVDKEIIGGVIIKIKSIMIDNSIKSKLMDFKI